MQTYTLSRLVRWGLPIFVAMLVSAGSTIAADKKADEGKTPPASEAAPIDDMSAHIEKQLASKGEVAYLDTQLGDAINDLKLRYRVDIHLDKDALTSEGKDETSVVNLMIKDVTLQSVLNRLMKQHGLVWTVADEGILITTKTGDANRTTVNVYSVADLGDGDGNIDYEELTEMLMQSVDPESWRTAGGTTGAIAKVSAKKSLVITQTYANHRAIAAILKQLAEK
jgi:hypothetical protein